MIFSKAFAAFLFIRSILSIKTILYPSCPEVIRRKLFTFLISSIFFFSASGSFSSLAEPSTTKRLGCEEETTFKKISLVLSTYKGSSPFLLLELVCGESCVNM